MKRNFNNKRVKKVTHLLNHQIRTETVRVVGEGQDGDVIPTSEAIKKAKLLNKDLICINDKPNPPIVIIEEYSKYSYNLQKKEKEKNKTLKKTSAVKETKLSINISEHDLEIKANRSVDFLKKGNKVKCTLMMRGRENFSPEKGKIVMLKFASIVEEHGVLEFMPKLDGNKWIAIIKPKK